MGSRPSLDESPQHSLLLNDGAREEYYPYIWCDVVTSQPGWDNCLANSRGIDNLLVFLVLGA